MSEAKELGAVDAILRSTTLTRERKIEALQQLAYDAREAEVATDEGMPDAAATPPLLAEVQRALRALGAEDDTESGAKQ